MMEQVRKVIDGKRDEIISTIRELVAVKSVGGEAPLPDAPFGPGPKAALEKFIEISDRMGFSTGVFENQVGWAEEGDASQELVTILAHVDVVPVGEGWSCDPFEGMIKDGFLYGRGVADDKGPAVCSLYALAALKEAGVKLRRRVRVMVGTNEEMGSAAVAHYVESGQELPVCGFTPDAEYPLINGEKGIITAHLSAPFAPSGDVKIVAFDGGVASNAVPDKATVDLEVADAALPRLRRAVAEFAAPKDAALEMEELGGGKFRLSMKGLAFHGSKPQYGSNAVAHLVALLRLVLTDGEQAKALEKFDRLVGAQSRGENLGLLRYDDVSGFTSMCWGLMKMDSDRVKFSLNYRYPVTLDPAKTEADFRQAAADAGFVIETISCATPLYKPEDDPLVVSLMKAYRQETGRMDDRPFSIGGGTYAKEIPNMLAFGICFQDENQHIHEIDECWEIDRIILTTKIIAAAIVELAC